MKTTNLKKMLCMLLVLIMAFSLFGCKKDAIDATENTDLTNATTEATEYTETIPSVDEGNIVETEPMEPAHIHEWTDEVTAPTCTSDGYTTHSCACGESEVDSYVAANGHTWGSWQTVEEATETATGKADRTCSVCSKVESRTIPKLSESHKHSYSSSVTTEPTCSNFGVKTFVCSCGDKYTEDIPKINHNYVPEIIPATCSVRGYTLYTCSVCNSSYKSNYTPVAGHNYDEVVTMPTCTEKGYTTYKCKNCGDSYIGNYVNPTGHVWSNWSVIKEATETSTGLKARTCKNCSEQETETIEKLPHTHEYSAKITTEATCEVNGVKTYTCSCGDAYTEAIPATGHNWTSWKTINEATETSTGTKERSCTKCKKVETEIIPKIEHSHSFIHIVTNPTCSSDGYTTHTCSTCGYSYTDSNVPKTGHSWGEWVTVIAPTTTSTGKAERICSSCGAKESKTLEKLPETHTHKYEVVERVDATCENDGYVKKACSCGETKTDRIPATGHNWKHHHQNEVGHYETYIMCHCGWSCSANIDYISAFAAHVNSVDPETRYDHSYYDISRWVVDTPARDWDECTKCHTIK